LLAEVTGKTGQLEAGLQAFSRFVPREFLTCLSKKSIVDVSLGDQLQADMAILFADIRSFTTMSEKMTPRVGDWQDFARIALDHPAGRG